MKKFHGLALAALLLAGCEIEDIVMEEVVTIEQEVIKGESSALGDYLRENYSGTSWIGTIEAIGIKQEPSGKVIMGVKTKQKEDFLLLQMPFVIWADNETTLKIEEIRFYHQEEVVHSIPR